MWLARRWSLTMRHQKKIGQEQNVIKKNSFQLSWNHTLICCRLIIYIIKIRGKITTKLGDIKSDPVNNPKGQNQNNKKKKKKKKDPQTGSNTKK